MRTKVINNGVANAAIILTAERMGYNPGYVEMAKNVIASGGNIEPILIGRFSGVATTMHNRIAQDMRFDEANSIAQGILSQYGY